jgi:hypothetical protein
MRSDQALCASPGHVRVQTPTNQLSMLDDIDGVLRRLSDRAVSDKLVVVHYAGASRELGGLTGGFAIFANSIDEIQEVACCAGVAKGAMMPFNLDVVGFAKIAKAV